MIDRPNEGVRLFISTCEYGISRKYSYGLTKQVATTITIHKGTTNLAPCDYIIIINIYRRTKDMYKIYIHTYNDAHHLH